MTKDEIENLWIERIIRHFPKEKNGRLKDPYLFNTVCGEHMLMLKELFGVDDNGSHMDKVITDNYGDRH